MNAEEVKRILLEIEDTKLEFSLIFSGKTSKKVNGLYKVETHEIIIHNRNFSSDNELIYTAIHEYTHHKQFEAEGLKNTKRPHTIKFWSMFHHLLGIAEEKGFYNISLKNGSELDEITKKIKNVLMVEDGRLLKELGSLLHRARELCKAQNVRYEDYIDRVLKLPRNTASSIEKMHIFNVDPSIGYDAMKTIANVKNAEKRKEVENLYNASKSPATFNAMLKKPKEIDEKTMLEKEKRRLELTIENMQKRLKEVEDKLIEMK